MNVQINADWRLVSDEYNITVEQRKLTDPTRRPGFDAAKHDATPRTVWTPKAHCRDVAQALTWYIDYNSRTSDVTTLVELRDLIVELRDEVEALYKTRLTD